MDKEHLTLQDWFSLEDFDGEVWKDVPNYEGMYSVSNYGRVKSLRRIIQCGRGEKVTKEMILKPMKDRLGYLVVDLRCEGKRKSLKIHRLVMLAHVPNPNNFPSINHIDEDKTNNIVTNLEWCSVSHNITWGEGHKRRVQSFINNNRSKRVLQYDDSLNLIKEFPSAAEAERQTGISGRAIRCVCDLRLLYAGGYIWLHNKSDLELWKNKKKNAKRNGRYKKNRATKFV